MNTLGFPRSAKRITAFTIALVTFGVLASVFVYVNARAATTYTWNQTGTASWATSTNWTPARTAPAAPPRRGGRGGGVGFAFAAGGG